MKRMLRCLLCFGVVAALCLSLTGCMLLDEMKAAQAFWDPVDETQPFESFTWNGAIYKQMPVTELSFSLHASEWKGVYVTQSDVPVLLSGIVGQYMELSDNEILAVYVDYMSSSADTVYYCRVDQYDVVLARLEAGDMEFNRCCYSWYEWEEDEYHYYVLTDAEYAAVQTVYHTVEAEVLPNGAEMYFDHEALLYQLSEDGLFEQMWVSACVVGDTYYLRSYDEDGNTVLYSAPEEYTAAFQSLLAAQIEVDIADAEYWGEDYYDDWEDEWEDEDESLTI